MPKQTFVVVQKRFYHDTKHALTEAVSEPGLTRAEAKALVEQLDNQVYHLDHGEYQRPIYQAWRDHTPRAKALSTIPHPARKADFQYV